MTATQPASTTTTAPEEARAAGLNPLDYLRQRGYVQDVSDEDGLRAAFAAGPVTAYVGFDPTASSLHVGHLLGIMMLASLQRFGHRPIALGGGGTALVGDPTGKTATRAVIAEETIRANLANILKQFDRHLDFAGGRFGDNPPALLLNNADWLLPLRYIEFLRDIGRHFSVNEMLAAETYRLRLETTGLNFVEFNYRLVQAYDFLHLYRTEGCLLQMGGSDQWGNIVAGVDLIRRADGGKAYALICPLLTTASGQKMGKTEGNSVWLDPAQTSPYDFYQYWINTDDADVPRLLRLYTFLPESRIAELTAATGPALREAKQVLAYEATALTHGEEEAHKAQEAARALFAGQVGPLDAVPTTEVSREEIGHGIPLPDLLVRVGLFGSKREARPRIQQGGVSLNDERVDDDRLVVGEAHLKDGGILLRTGKRFHRIVVKR